MWIKSLALIAQCSPNGQNGISPTLAEKLDLTTLLTLAQHWQGGFKGG